MNEHHYSKSTCRVYIGRRGAGTRPMWIVLALGFTSSLSQRDLWFLQCLGLMLANQLGVPLADHVLKVA